MGNNLVSFEWKNEYNLVVNCSTWHFNSVMFLCRICVKKKPLCRVYILTSGMRKSSFSNTDYYVVLCRLVLFKISQNYHVVSVSLSTAITRSPNQYPASRWCWRLTFATCTMSSLEGTVGTCSMWWLTASKQVRQPLTCTSSRRSGISFCSFCVLLQGRTGLDGAVVDHWRMLSRSLLTSCWRPSTTAAWSLLYRWLQLWLWERHTSN